MDMIKYLCPNLWKTTSVKLAFDIDARPGDAYMHQYNLSHV